MSGRSPRLFAALIFVIGIVLLFVTSLVFQRPNKSYTTGIIFNQDSHKHNRIGHPESALRVEAIKQFLTERNILKRVKIFKERSALIEELYLAHEKTYVDKVLSEQRGNGFFNDDKWSPYIAMGSIQSALTAVGSLVVLSEAVAKSEIQNGFAVIRPPGHHATPNLAMGYCIFNNIAIATKNLLKKGLANRVLIIDLDAHFGNGIAEIFKNDPKVYYLSHNQALVFPYSNGVSTDHIKDIKVPFLFPEADYLRLFKENVSAAFAEFKPDFVFVSAGFDGHWRDYMSNLTLSLITYAELSKFVVEKAKENTSGKIVFSLEGGYDLEALSVATYNSILALLGDTNFEDPIGPVSSN